MPPMCDPFLAPAAIAPHVADADRTDLDPSQVLLASAAVLILIHLVAHDAAVGLGWAVLFVWAGIDETRAGELEALLLCVE